MTGIPTPVATGLVRAGRVGDRTVLWNPDSGQRFLVGARVADLVARFDADSSEWPGRDVVAARLMEIGILNGAEGGEDSGDGRGIDGPRRADTSDGAASSVAMPEPSEGSALPGLFGSVRTTIRAALAGDDIDVVVVGVPYDQGATGRPGARYGPHYLRNASLNLFRNAADPNRGGMALPGRRTRVLAGVGIADLGDVSTRFPSRNDDTFAALERITAAAVEAGKLPVMLGGDHSLTLAAVRGVLSALPEGERLGIVHFDAHADLSRERTDDWRNDCHHGNFMDWLLGDPRVASLSQLGVRQLTDHDPVESPKLTCWPERSACDVPVAEVLAGLPTDRRYYVTVDVDCLDPSIMPSTGTPLPGGFRLDELRRLVTAVCGQREVVGMDITEFLPDGDQRSGAVAADVLLRAIDSAVRR